MKIKYSFKQILVFLWIIISVLYILFDLYQGVVVSMYNKGYLDSQAATIAKLIQNAQNEQCEPVSVSNDQDTVNLINVQCLQTNLAENVSDNTGNAE